MCVRRQSKEEEEEGEEGREKGREKRSEIGRERDLARTHKGGERIERKCIYFFLPVNTSPPCK